jgi:threonyl-tRNA synthetase
VQVKVIPISENFEKYARQVEKELKQHDIRSEIDHKNEKVGYKIREAEIKKIPYMLIVGEKEENSNTVSVRKHTVGDQGTSSLTDFISELQKEIKSKK